jgi:hypothetical protein
MTAIFVIEAIAKIIAQGFYNCGHTSYMLNSWNILDFLVVIITVSLFYTFSIKYIVSIICSKFPRYQHQDCEDLQNAQSSSPFKSHLQESRTQTFDPDVGSGSPRDSSNHWIVITLLLRLWSSGHELFQGRVFRLLLAIGEKR